MPIYNIIFHNNRTCLVTQKLQHLKKIKIII